MRSKTLLTLALVSTASVATAFIPMGPKWANDEATLGLSQTAFPTGSAQEQAVLTAAAEWSAIAGSRFFFNMVSLPNGNAAVTHGDGISGVAFSSSVGGGTLGLTLTEEVGNTRRAADVLFNPNVNWTFATSPAWNAYYFLNTARHEFGHALGLDHSNLGCQALMGGGCGAPGMVRSFTQDDNAGAQYLYPGTSRSSATPSPTPGPTGQVDWRMSAVAVQPQTAAAGGSVAVQYTVDNAGTASAATAPERVYLLSTNATLSMQDTVLMTTSTNQGPFAPGAGFQTGSNVNIPQGTNPGTYWLGVMIDPNDTVTEADEQNNAEAVQVQITSASQPQPQPQPQPTPQPQPQPAGDIDWAAVSVKLTPTQLASGDVLDLEYTIKQVGSADATSVPEVWIVVSDNATISSQDQQLAKDAAATGSYQIGAEVTRTEQFTITGPAGTYYVGVLIDPNNQTVEASKANNTAFDALVVDAGSTTSTPPTTGTPSTPATGTSQPAATGPAPGTPGSTVPLASGSGGGGGGGCVVSAPLGGTNTSALWLLFAGVLTFARICRRVG